MAANDIKKEQFKKSAIVSGIGFLVLVIVLFGSIMNIKKNIKNTVKGSGEYITEKLVAELKSKCIVKESIAVEVAAPVEVTTDAALVSSEMVTTDAAVSSEMAVTTEPAIVYQEVEKFSPELQYISPNSLTTIIGDAPAGKNYENIANIAIWKKDNDGNLVNVIHSMDKFNQKGIFGLAEGEEKNEENIKDYFRQKLENAWLVANFDKIVKDGYQTEEIDEVFNAKDRETLHAVRKFEVLGEEYLLDIQYDKTKGIIENTMTGKIQRTIIVGGVIYLLFLLVYSLLMDRKMLMHVLVFYFLIFTVYPITWVVSLTFKNDNSMGGTNLNPIPKEATLDNYRAALFNLKKMKKEGIVYQDGRLFIEESDRMAGLVFKQTPMTMGTFETEFTSMAGTQRYDEILGELTKLNSDSLTLEKLFRTLEVKAKQETKEMKSYPEYSQMREGASEIGKGYIKLSKKIKSLAEKITDTANRESAIDFGKRMEVLGKDFKNTGKDLKLAIEQKNISAIYNVFDPARKNLLKESNAKLVIDEQIDTIEYNGNVTEYIKNKYYINIGKTETFDVNGVYTVEYYTNQDFLFISGILASIFVAIATAFVGMMLSSTAAYAFSRFKFPGREGFMMSFLITQMFPNIMMLIPLFIIFKTLGLIDTFMGLILAYSITALPFNIWNLKGYFDTVPKDLEEAALIDGCSASQTFYKIVLPLSLPSLAISGLFSFMAAWNEYIVAATFINTESKYTIPVVIKMLVSANDVNWPMFATMSVLVSIPVVIVFLMTQKYLVGGLTAGGVKG